MPRKSRLYALFRAEIVKTAQEQGIATITEIAKRFDRTSAAISMLVSRLRQREAKSSQKPKYFTPAPEPFLQPDNLASPGLTGG